VEDWLREVWELGSWRVVGDEEKLGVLCEESRLWDGVKSTRRPQGAERKYSGGGRSSGEHGGGGS
jgi:hypothetical protein